MLTILFDETGRAVGRSDASGVPGYVLGPNEVPCTPEQFADPAAWARGEGDVLVPATDRDPVPARGVTYKVDLYDRTTDQEADAIEVALAAAPVRLRRLFESAIFLDHSRPEFAMIRENLEGMFGKTRTAELLAAS